MDSITRVSPRAVHLPEILNNVFNQAENTSADLYRYSLVCKQWSSLAIKTLWRRSTPDISDLLNLYKQRVLAKYIPLMQHLRIDCKECHRYRQGRPCPNEEAHELIKDLCDIFPRLTVLSLDVRTEFKKVNEYYLNSLITHHLRCARFPTAVHASEMLALIKAKSPDLESLYLQPRVYGLGCEDDDASSFISRTPKLRKMKGPLIRISSRTFLQLAELRHLEKVYVFNLESDDWVDILSSSAFNARSLFPALRTLDIRGDNVSDSHVGRLLSMDISTQLRKLKVFSSTASANSDLLSVLTNYPHLESVALTMNSSERQHCSRMCELTPESLLKVFQACRYLRKFTLDGCSSPRFGTIKVSGWDVCNAFMALPHIRELELPWSCSLGARELRTLRDSCPNLLNLYLEKSKLNYIDLITDPDPPVLARIVTFLDCEGWRRGTSLPLPKPAWKSPMVSKDEQAEILCRVLPSVFGDIPRLATGGELISAASQ